MGSCRLKSALGIAALILGGSGCEGAGAANVGAHTTYVGSVEGTSVRIAVVRAGDAIEAYVCGEGETLVSHTRWFEGELDARDAGAAELLSDGWRLRALDDDDARLSGELIAPDGAIARWQAARVAVDTHSAVGLYDSHELGCRAGVIVWSDGPCRAQGAWCDDAGDIGQITPAECPAGGTLRVDALREDGETLELTVERVEGPY